MAEDLILVASVAMTRSGDAYEAVAPLNGVERKLRLTAEGDLRVLEIRGEKDGGCGSGRLARRPGGYTGVVPTLLATYRVQAVRDGEGVRVELWAPPAVMRTAPEKRVLAGAELAAARLRS